MKKKIYVVNLQPSTVYAKSVEIEAESMDEAIKLAQANHCGKEMVEVSYSANWIQPKPEDAEEGWECFEYCHQVHGQCDDCGVTLFESHGEKNPDHDHPWDWEAGDTRHHTYICYPCAMKRKEAKNYCPFFKHFYRSYKEGCDKCPEGGCDTLKERMAQNLKKALSYCNASPTAVNTFLDEGRIRLAYETLNEAKSDHGEFAAIMGRVKQELDEGWLD